MSANALRSECRELGLDQRGKKNSFVKRLEQHYCEIEQTQSTLVASQQAEKDIATQEVNDTVFVPRSRNSSTPISTCIGNTNTIIHRPTEMNACASIPSHVAAPTITYSSEFQPPYTAYTHTTVSATQQHQTYVPQNIQSQVSFANPIHTNVVYSNPPMYHHNDMYNNYVTYPNTSNLTTTFYTSKMRNNMCIDNPYNNVRDMISVLPEFNPLNVNSLRSEQYIERITQLKNVYCWDDKTLLFAINSKMQGPARLWINSCSIFNNWSEFVQQFLRDFPSEFNVEDLHLEMAENKQKRFESAEEYYYRMLACGRKGNLPDCAISKYIIRGMYDKEFVKTVSTNYFANCNDLLSAIRRYYSMVSSRVEFSKQTFKNLETPVDKTKTVPVFRPTKDKNQLLCYNCFNTGHISIRCPEPPRRERCSICYRTNHKTAECPEKKNKEPNSRAPVHKIETSNQTMNLENIMKIVEINEQKYNGFVDPGSKRTLIKKSIAGNLGPFLSCEIVLYGFAGGVYHCKNQIKLSIKMDDSIYEMDVLIVDDDLLQYDILLGKDILCGLGRRLVIENEKCWVENDLDINTGSTLTEDESNKLKSVLNKYKNCFASSVRELGKCSTMKMKIELSKNVSVASKPYRLAYSKRPVVENIITELLQYDIIRPSDSEYASPIVLIEKKNGENRLCVDYRRLNKITIKQPFPMPNLEDQFTLLAGHKLFTTLDLKMGYHQIEIDELSKRYTAFVTHHAHFEYQRMPFGLVNAPGIFQKIMNKIVTEFKPRKAICYLDDIVLPSKNFADGIENLEQFLIILQKHGLTVRLDKCKFLADEINYLGHVVNENGIMPGCEKLDSIALIAKPLTNTLRKSEQKNFNWTKENENSFKK